tara:strand:- start:86 stop:865 length:780 start_codon:yes stop_codon:yes gene_type:complete
MNNILVVGDSCIDVYIAGSVDRISPEAPVPVIKKLSEIMNPGMCLNVLGNLKALFMFGIGLDKVNIDFITQKEEITKTRILDIKSKQHLLRIDVDPKIESVFNRDISSDYTHLIISDYDKGFLSPEDCAFLCKKFKGKPIFVDSKKKDLSCFKDCIIKINDLEEENAYDIDASNTVITTLGAKGARLNNKIYKSNAVDVFDVCGAGDVFLASLFYYMLENNIEDSIKFANICAGISVTKPGVYTLVEKDIKKAKDLSSN